MSPNGFKKQARRSQRRLEGASEKRAVPERKLAGKNLDPHCHVPTARPSSCRQCGVERRSRKCCGSPIASSPKERRASEFNPPLAETAAFVLSRW